MKTQLAATVQTECQTAHLRRPFVPIENSLQTSVEILEGDRVWVHDSLAVDLIRESLTLTWRTANSTQEQFSYSTKEEYLFQPTENGIQVPATMLPDVLTVLEQAGHPYDLNVDPKRFDGQHRLMALRACGHHQINRHHLLFNSEKELLSHLLSQLRDCFLRNECVAVVSGFKRNRLGLLKQLKTYFDTLNRTEKKNEQDEYRVQDSPEYQQASDKRIAVITVEDAQTANKDIWKHMIFVEPEVLRRKNIPEYLRRTSINTYLYRTQHGQEKKLDRRIVSLFGQMDKFSRSAR